MYFPVNLFWFDGRKNPGQRGRPKGSYGRKKREELERLSQQSRLRYTRSQPDVRTLDVYNMSDTEPVDSDEEAEDLTSKFSKIVDRAMRKISQDLKDLDKEVRGVIDTHTKQIKDLQTKNKRLAERVSSLETKIQDLQKDKESHADQINKQERFSRRNNLRIVGFKTEAGENPIEIAKAVFTKAGVENCRIERAHRDGRMVEGRNRHILVKVSFYMDKVTLLRNSRSHLSNEEFFLTDDLTLIDLKEKRKYSREVAELYRNGTKLRFFEGHWRSSDGKPYNFPSSQS